MMQTAAELEERGVYLGRNLLKGFRYLYAVTSRGEVLPKVLPLRPDVDEDRAWRRMWALLDGLDPLPPRLELVKPDPQPRREITLEQLDRLYIDANPVAAMLYQRKRERLRGVQRPLPRLR